MDASQLSGNVFIKYKYNKYNKNIFRLSRIKSQNTYTIEIITHKLNVTQMTFRKYVSKNICKMHIRIYV